MLSQVRTKIRALIEDTAKSDFEAFTYTNSSVFILSESNILSIVEVSKNSSALGSGDYSYDSTTNKLTITGSVETFSFEWLTGLGGVDVANEILGWPKVDAAQLNPQVPELIRSQNWLKTAKVSLLRYSDLETQKFLSSKIFIPDKIDPPIHPEISLLSSTETLKVKYSGNFFFSKLVILFSIPS